MEGIRGERRGGEEKQSSDQRSANGMWQGRESVDTVGQGTEGGIGKQGKDSEGKGTSQLEQSLS